MKLLPKWSLLVACAVALLVSTAVELSGAAPRPQQQAQPTQDQVGASQNSQGTSAGQTESPESAAETPAKKLTPAEATSHVGDLTGSGVRGKDLYRRYCIGCHGPRGDGEGENAPYIDPKPRDFTEATFKCRSTPTGTLPTDQDLFNAITRGFVTTNMPQWRPLTEQDRTDLVAYIKTFSPRWVTEKPGTPIQIPAETPVTLDSIKRGHELFEHVECWKCHGQQARGDGPSASTLTDSKDRPIRPYDFSSGERFKCGETNADLYRIFMTGVDGTPMPSFADNIKPDQAWDLVHFLRTLQPHHHGPEIQLVNSAQGHNSGGK